MTDLAIKSSNILKQRNLHELSYEDSFEELDTYEKFLNWISGEFTLYLQDNINDLIVYFPNGKFTIKKIDSNYNFIQFKIIVKSKCLKKGTQIFSKLKSILTHIKRF